MRRRARLARNSGRSGRSLRAKRARGSFQNPSGKPAPSPKSVKFSNPISVRFSKPIDTRVTPRLAVDGVNRETPGRTRQPSSVRPVRGTRPRSQQAALGPHQVNVGSGRKR